MRIEDEIIDLGDHQLLLRNAVEEDAEMLLECLKTTCGETRFLVKEPEEIDLTLEDERKFIHSGGLSNSFFYIIRMSRNKISCFLDLSMESTSETVP